MPRFEGGSQTTPTPEAEQEVNFESPEQVQEAINNLADRLSEDGGSHVKQKMSSLIAAGLSLGLTQSTVDNMLIQSGIMDKLQSTGNQIELVSEDFSTEATQVLEGSGVQLENAGIELPQYEPSVELQQNIATFQEAAKDKDYLQPEGTTLDSMIEGGQEVLEAYTEKIEELGSILGAKVMLGPLKERDRSQEKIDEYTREIAEANKNIDGSERPLEDASRMLVDVVRGSLVFQTVDELFAALPEIQSSLNVTRSKERIQENLKKGGYGDMLLNVEINGMSTELQLHVESVIEAKKEGHKVYDQERYVEGELGKDMPVTLGGLQVGFDGLLNSAANKIDEKIAELDPITDAEKITTLEAKKQDVFDNMYPEMRSWLKEMASRDSEELTTQDVQGLLNKLKERQVEIYTPAWKAAI